mgnify:CR=1 FL=1
MVPVLAGVLVLAAGHLRGRGGSNGVAAGATACDDGRDDGHDDPCPPTVREATDKELIAQATEAASYGVVEEHSQDDKVLGDGFLVDLPGSDLDRSAGLATSNRWYRRVDGIETLVLVGARRTPYEDGNAAEGAVSVTTWQIDGLGLNLIDGHVYEAPKGVGGLRIIDADGSILVLTSEDGEKLWFDVDKRTFSGVSPSENPARQ